MLINPEKNTTVKKFLEGFFQKMKFLVLDHKDNRKEFRWSLVLEYILLKSLANNKLSNHLSKEIPELLENSKILIKSELKKEKDTDFIVNSELRKNSLDSYFKTGLENPFIIRNHLYSIKHDYELRILFSLFGGKYLSQKLSDLSGFFYFTNDDLKDLNGERFILKYQAIKNHIEKGPNHCIAINSSYHWLALISALKIGKDHLLILNDPNKTKQIKKKISKRKFSDKDLFYFFKYDLKNAIILTEEIKEFLEKELSKEKNLLINLLRMIKKDKKEE